MLVYTFKDEKKWYEYNAYNILNMKYKSNKPHVIISTSEKELPEFTNSINLFSKKMDEKNINFQYSITPGTHQRPDIQNLIVFLMEKINN